GRSRGRRGEEDAGVVWRRGHGVVLDRGPKEITGNPLSAAGGRARGPGREGPREAPGAIDADRRRIRRPTPAPPVLIDPGRARWGRGRDRRRGRGSRGDLATIPPGGNGEGAVGGMDTWFFRRRRRRRSTEVARRKVVIVHRVRRPPTCVYP